MSDYAFGTRSGHSDECMCVTCCTIEEHKQRTRVGKLHVLAGRLPSDAAKRKATPVATGCVDYFPDAIVEVAELSRIGNDQHNPGKKLFWDRSKSGDEADALMRHFIDRGTRDVDGVRHSAKVAWRALALLQKEIEAERAAAAGDGGSHGER
jgi:hypothetical protein